MIVSGPGLPAHEPLPPPSFDATGGFDSGWCVESRKAHAPDATPSGTPSGTATATTYAGPRVFVRSLAGPLAAAVVPSAAADATQPQCRLHQPQWSGGEAPWSGSTCFSRRRGRLEDSHQLARGSPVLLLLLLLTDCLLCLLFSTSVDISEVVDISVGNFRYQPCLLCLNRKGCYVEETLLSFLSHYSNELHKGISF